MGLFRKLLRRSFYAASVSTLLLLTTLILWPVSYFRVVSSSYEVAGESKFSAGGRFGRVYLSYATSHEGPIRSGVYFQIRESPANYEDSWSYLTWRKSDPYDLFPDPSTTTFGILWHSYHYSVVIVRLFIPLSYLALLFSILPLLAFRSIRRRRKLARVGLCGKCGYDLRAHAIGEKCPECGTQKKG